MYSKALEKAQRRYRVASASFEAMQAAEDYASLADQWYIFLHAAKGIYTTLEQGAKATPQARQWFGKMDRERKNDPLLRYVSEARNDDEHGIEENTEFKKSSLRLGVSAPGSSKAMTDQFGNMFINCGTIYDFEGGNPSQPNLPVLQSLDGKPIHSVFEPARIILKPVRDRSKNQYDPPKSHLGNDLQTDGPIEVAELALKYLEGLLSQAAGFHRP